MKINLLIITDVMFEVFNRTGRGINKTISISNTIKMIAKRKNRIENGIRALWFGSNPHSNGEAFSRSLLDREANAHVRKKRINGIRIANIDDVINIFMLYS
jgi:hypothetical protein